MRQVQDDQLLDHLRQVHRELPGHHAAPVVTHDRRPIAAEMADHGGDVADEQAHVVVLDALRLVAQVVAALIDRDDLEVSASAAIWCRHEYQKSGKPWIITTSGPVPSVA